LRPPSPPSPRFPYTTLFRSRAAGSGADARAGRELSVACVQRLLGIIGDDLPVSQHHAAPGIAPLLLPRSSCDPFARLSHRGNDLDRKSTRLNSRHVKISYAV